MLQKVVFADLTLTGVFAEKLLRNFASQNSQLATRNSQHYTPV